MPGTPTLSAPGFRLAASGGIYAWELLDNGEDVSVRVTGTTLVNDPIYAKELALAGVGIDLGSASRSVAVGASSAQAPLRSQ